MALPATAPIRGIGEPAHQPADRVGANRVSASSATTTSPLAMARPRFSAWALPPLAKRISRTRGSSPKAFSHLSGGVVGGAVVQHQHLQIGPVGLQDPRDRGGDHLLLVEAGDQHADQRPGLGIQHRRRAGPSREAVPQRQDRQERQPRHAEHDGGDQQGVAGTRPPRGRSRSRCGRASARRSRAGSGGMAWAGVMPAKFGDGHQLIAVGAQLIDQLRQRRHRAAAVAAGIVQQHDLAAGVRIGVGQAQQGGV